MASSTHLMRTAGLALALAALSGCDDDAPALSHATPQESDEFERHELGPIRNDGPFVGALVNAAPIYEAMHKKARVLGYFRAGERLPRSEAVHENDQCIGGWVQVAPVGYVCTEKSATLDEQHPTLSAMALQANLDAALPYVYARTTRTTARYEKTEKDSVELSGRHGKSTTMAIVGSWTAPDESLEPLRLGLRTDGSFVRADHLEAARSSDFQGVTLGADLELPVAYVVRRGVRAWTIEDGSAQKTEELDYHTRLDLTGRYRTIVGEKFWATRDGRWVRHKDVTAVRQRYEFPEFVTPEQKWIDVSIIMGTAVFYEGQKPVYATLVSVGRDRRGDPKTTASTEQGTFAVVKKMITRRAPENPDSPALDQPWALELENGQWVYAAVNHDRFGIEHTDGDIHLSPRDARFLFHWSDPPLPRGWHGVVKSSEQATTLVNVR